MVELRKVRSGYPSRPVLNDVSLAFRPGEVLTLAGPNGCGKSTLLRTANGLLPKSGGELLLDGAPVEMLTPNQIARKIACLPQSRPVPSITARRMVLHGRFPYLSYPRRYRKEDYAMVDHALRWVGAEELADIPLPQLSGGQRQRIYLAMALAQDTETILMDEPTTYLDVKHQLEVMGLAHQLASQGRAVVLVLHDLCLAMQHSDRIAVLSDGKILRVGTPEEVYQSGVLDDVFSVALRRMETEDGWRYYYISQEGM